MWRPTNKNSLTLSATSLRSCSASLDSGRDRFSENILFSRREIGNWTMRGKRNHEKKVNRDSIFNGHYLIFKPNICLAPNIFSSTCSWSVYCCSNIWSLTCLFRVGLYQSLWVIGSSVYIIGDLPANHIGSFGWASPNHRCVQMVWGEQGLAEQILIFFETNHATWREYNIRSLLFNMVPGGRIKDAKQFHHMWYNKHLTFPAARQQGKTALYQEKTESFTPTDTEKYLPFTGVNVSVHTWKQLLQQAQYFQQQSSRSASSNKRNKRSGSSHRRLAGGQSEGSSQK